MSVFTQAEYTIKTTKSDLKPDLVELDGHRIGDTYAGSESSGFKTLTYISKRGHLTLVDCHGRADLLDIGATDALEKLPERQLDWLTWQYKGYNKYYHGPLSNFYVEMDGKTLEHRFAALKTVNLDRKLEILQAKTPGEAKKLGRKAPLVPGWDDIKLDLMWDLLLKKFLANNFAREYLLSTDDITITEKNTWNDTIWGRNIKGHGQNLLGHGLMYVRNVLSDSRANAN